MCALRQVFLFALLILITGCVDIWNFSTDVSSSNCVKSASNDQLCLGRRKDDSYELSFQMTAMTYPPESPMNEVAFKVEWVTPSTGQTCETYAGTLLAEHSISGADFTKFKEGQEPVVVSGPDGYGMFMFRAGEVAGDRGIAAASFRFNYYNHPIDGNFLVRVTALMKNGASVSPWLSPVCNSVELTAPPALTFEEKIPVKYAEETWTTSLPVCGSTSASEPWCQTLSALYAQGLASGNVGDVYANGDGDHSKYQSLLYFPQVLASPAKSYTDPKFPGHPQITNASYYGYAAGYLNYGTWIPGLDNFYGSNARMFVPSSYDAINGISKLKSMHPGLLVTEGQSNSEHDEISLTYAGMAALRPSYKQCLRRRGLVTELLKGVEIAAIAGDDLTQQQSASLTSQAHPHAFHLTNRSYNKLMVDATQRLSRQNSLPFSRLAVVYETFKDETIYDSKHALARNHLETAKVKTMIVRATDSFDLANKELKYEWKLLHGPSSAVTIEPLNERASEVKLTFSYVPFQFFSAGFYMDVITIGVFSTNGSFYSPPSYISVHQGTGPL